MRKLILVYILSTLGAKIYGQNTGHAFLKNYSSQLYQAETQNWAILQDKRGILYFANDKGILEYDGTYWRLIQTSNKSAVRSMSMSKEGVIYIGASNDFGYLAPDSLGKMTYFSLLKHVDKAYKNFADVWTTQATNEGIYFHTDNILFLYKPDSNTISTWAASAESYFFLTFYVNNRLYIHDVNAGLMQINDGKVGLVPNGKRFADQKIYTILSYNSQTLLVGTRSQGLFLFHTKRLKDNFEKFETEVDDFLLKNQLYNGTRLPNGNFVFCTTRGGVVVINKKGKLLQKVDKSMGLQDQNVRATFQSKDKVLWLALDDGISQVNINYPVRFWKEDFGLNGTIKSIRKFENKIYVATSTGVFYLANNSFYKVLGVNTQCWSLLDHKIDGTKQLLVGTNNGVYRIINNRAIMVFSTGKEEALTLYQSPQKPNRVFVGLKGGLEMFEFKDGFWYFEGRVRDLEEEIYSIAEDYQGKVWLGTANKGVVRLDINYQTLKAEIEYLGEDSGLTSLNDIYIYNLGKKLIFTSKDGLMVFDEHKQRFVESDILGKDIFGTKRDFYQLASDNDKNIWVTAHESQPFAIGRAELLPNGTYKWDNTPLKRLPEFSEAIAYPTDAGVVWLGGSDGLFRYKPNKRKKYDAEYYALVRQVVVDKDTIFGGAFSDKEGKVSLKQNESFIPELHFRNNLSIEFSFAAPFFDAEDRIAFSYYLESYDEGWSDWVSDTKKQYTSLPEGTYTFHIKAKNVYDKESKEARFTFRVLPPWYRTAYAYFAYVVLTTLLIFGGVRIYTYRLRRQKHLLEETVAERTTEIKATNEALEKERQKLLLSSENLRLANEEIREKSSDITASISYASRIQQVMLPREEVVKSAFTDSFILFQPRDIVSGDFYWFGQTPLEAIYVKDPSIEGMPSVFKTIGGGKKIISAVDCTGHGVPGAFMSMVGDSYLNEIVHTKGIYQPHLILRELNESIKTALKQDTSENLDGMDMTICVINEKNKTLEFAGAKNPLIYIQNGELQQIRGEKFGIGGFQFDDTEKVFQRHVISIDKPTWFYIFSDGFQDQFGGKRGRKFMIKRMKDLIFENYRKPMVEQKRVLEQTLQSWMQYGGKEYEQVDDILVIGVYLNPEDFESER